MILPDDDVYMYPGLPLESSNWTAARYWPVLSDAIDDHEPDGADVCIQVLPYPLPNTIIIL